MFFMPWHLRYKYKSILNFPNKSDETLQIEAAVEQTFGTDMGNLFKQGLFTDFTIKAADGKEFKVKN
jgi:hypothetical protein